MSASNSNPCMVNGLLMALDLHEGIQAQMATGAYEPVESGWVRKYIGPGSVFVDVGANFGWYTTLALSLMRQDGQVFAFEPSPNPYTALKRAIELSGYKNITLVNAAVGRKVGEITIHIPAGGPIHSPSVFESPGDFSPLRVPITSLDEFAPTRQRAVH
jgi:FkbM family methyltransferase